MAKVATKVNKPALYKMIAYKGVKGVQSTYTPLTAAQRLPKVEKSFNTGFSSVMAGLNSIGQTLNSIASNTQTTLETWRDNIREQIANNAALVKQEEKEEKLEKKRVKAKEKQQKDQRKLKARDKTEKKLEKKKKKKGIGESIIEKTKETGGGLLASLQSLLKTLITYKIFEWIAKNPKAVQTFAVTLANIGKFVFNVVGLLAGLTLDGLTEFLENPISLKGFFGIFKFLLGAVPLFGTFLFLKNPKLMIKTIGMVVKGLLGGLKRLFGLSSKADKLKALKLKKIGGQKGNFFSSKLGKFAVAGGTGVAAAMAVSASGGSAAEAGGAGVGAAGGQMLGAKLGSMSGIPGMGAVGGALGGLAGGKIGQAVGGLIEPIVEPISKFFKQIQTVFGSVIADIKKPLEEFFTTLGAFMSQILEVVEPHLPMITKIISTGIQVIFGPLFLGIKALTAVLKLFTGGDKKEAVGDKPKGKMDGGKVPPLAKGGWISGPQSGYPVSVDGGNSISFIGHGTEWVGKKKASGGAFVVPFDTPATKSNKSLTTRRYKEAERGGYTLPTYAWGGQWLKDRFNEHPAVRLAKFTGKHLSAKDSEGKPTGVARWLAGAADTATGGAFDFDKRGSMLEGATRLKDNVGSKIEEAKQKETERRHKKLQEQLEGGTTTVIEQEAPALQMGSGMAEDNPIVVPGDHHLDADKYIQPKYGLVAEFLTDPVEFM